MIGYWNLKNKDLGMAKLGKERAELIFNEITKLIQKYCKGSYEDIYAKDDQPLYFKSDQRIDFMLHIYQNLMKYCTSKLSELEDERDRRMY